MAWARKKTVMAITILFIMKRKNGYDADSGDQDFGDNDDNDDDGDDGGADDGHHNDYIDGEM